MSNHPKYPDLGHSGLSSAYDQTPEAQHAAALIVCGKARDVPDAIYLLEVLGLYEPHAERR